MNYETLGNKLIEMSDIYRSVDDGSLLGFDAISNQIDELNLVANTISEKIEKLNSVNYALKFHVVKKSFKTLLSEYVADNLSLNFTLFRWSSKETDIKWRLNSRNILFKKPQDQISVDTLIEKMKTILSEIKISNHKDVGSLVDEKSHDISLSADNLDQLDELFLNKNLLSTYRKLSLDGELKLAGYDVSNKTKFKI